MSDGASAGNGVPLDLVERGAEETCASGLSLDELALSFALTTVRVLGRRCELLAPSLCSVVVLCRGLAGQITGARRE